jgi:hypothetical protein
MFAAGLFAGWAFDVHSDGRVHFLLFPNAGFHQVRRVIEICRERNDIRESRSEICKR